MKTKLSILFLAFLLPLFASNAFAGWGNISVTIGSLAQIDNHPYHAPGNLEIAVKGGFTLPAGVSCDTTYITTRKDRVSNRMYSLFLTARILNQPISITITDDPAYTAFTGRCSILSVVF